MLKSIDTSKWDGGGKDPVTGLPLNKTVDWAAYSAAGWAPAFIKCSQGTVIDPLFKLQWAAARGRVYRSAYHFFHPSIDPIASVDKFIEYHEGDDGELPPVLDTEVTDGLPANVIASRALAWLKEYERRKGKKPIVYSSPYFLRDVMKTSNHPEFSNYHLWLAAYPYDTLGVGKQIVHEIITGKQEFISLIPAPAPFQKITFRQWTAIGDPLDVPGYYTGPGSKLEVDFNFYFGTLANLVAEFNLPALPIGEIPMSNFTVTTQRSNMSLRDDHNTGSNRIGSIPNANTQRGASEIWTAPADLFNNSGVQINKAGDKWAKLDTGEWIAITHLGVVYCSYVTNTPTPPPDPDPEPEPNKPALLEMNLAAGSTVVIKDADGNVIWSGTA